MLWTGALVSLSAASGLIYGAPNAAYLLFEGVSRWLPGGLVTLGIEAILWVLSALDVSSTAEAAKTAEKALAVVSALVAGALAGVVIAAIARGPRRSPAVIGLVVGLVAAVIPWLLPATTVRSTTEGLIALDVLLVAWGLMIGISVSAAVRVETGGRRRALGLLAAGAVALTGLGLVALRWLRRNDGSPPAAGGGLPANHDVLRAADRIEPVPKTRPELTSNADFYRVDINLTPPSLDAGSWRLDAGGLVARPVSLGIEQLRRRPAVTRTITLECISNPVGGDLISTARWTGLRLADLLEELGVKPAARAVAWRAADGFHESTRLDDAYDRETLLVYEMNGVPLPVEHGFPLRLYMPNRHGMKLPKWIVRMDLVDREIPGYWVERGWSREAIVHTTSVIDAVDVSRGPEGPRLSAGGIAFAGGRGISRVQVQVDGGPWRDASLRVPPLSALTWVQWRYDGPVAPGEHTLRVRAFDGTGAIQETETQTPHPDGATGIHSVAFTAL